MADAHRRYAEGRHPALPALLEQRPHLDSDVHRGQDYYGRDDKRGAPCVMGGGDSLGSARDCCPCGEILCYYNRDEKSIPIDDQRIMYIGGAGPDGKLKWHPLPPDASSTLFVEGLPPNCSRREVSHIFRIFIGYKEVRLVTMASRHSNGDPLVHCFVDFRSPSYAATAMCFLQGYILDEQDPNSTSLTIQFAHSPGASSSDGHRGQLEPGRLQGC
ncbi:RNA-binding protein 1-like [Heracleum sosnowskyi]|uniref:RNA-binding protein 1-like n=1 Tax=Heracleum sosnowskyi TaxID=360622 RepID=A0AAD8HH73_9APIA|nr:RNA-binding protein 1-like [Heracleum sosnowskyi]